MEIFRTLGALIEPPRPELAPLCEALELGPLPSMSEHTDLLQFQLYPYASVYLGPEGMLGGEARDTIAGFWRALGLVPPTEPDHLTVMLAFIAELGRHEAEDIAHAELWCRARQTFLSEHLLSWLPMYLAKLEGLVSEDSFYRRWGRLLRQCLTEETAGVDAEWRPSIHLDSVPALADPREAGLEAFLDALLSPVRSGVVWVRDDLRRAAQRLELGTRAGERRFVLKALLGQDAAATLDWLADEAAAWGALLKRQAAQWGESCGAAFRHWTARAEATAGLLTELEEIDR
ncbi:MAG: molecular chaperone TorD family protein [Acidobacteriota bacterium]